MCIEGLVPGNLSERGFFMEKTYPRQGCGAIKDITGCRFSISVMSDNFIPVILGAIKNVDTKNVWSATDLLSTVYRGKRIHVMDCLKTCFVQVNDGKTHITMEAAISNDCPGDTEDDSDPAECDAAVQEAACFQGSPLLCNNQKKFDVLCKISFYPLGIADYMDHITFVVKLASDRGLCCITALPSRCPGTRRLSGQSPILKGDVNEIFDYFDAILTYAEQNISHYVLQVTLSVNSPSAAG